MRIARSFPKIFSCLLLLVTMLTPLLVYGGSEAAKDSSQAGNDKSKAKFNSACASCHGKDGAGTALGKSIQAPDLRSEPVQKHSDAMLAQVIAEGKGDMPSFKNSFNDEQIRSLVQYVRGLASKKDSTPK
ncbi:MAG TPA: cytochrome c [Terriglobales bacterium]|nr:cytochrome c [Terriglobales bacterium]